MMLHVHACKAVDNSYTEGATRAGCQAQLKA